MALHQHSDLQRNLSKHARRSEHDGGSDEALRRQQARQRPVPAIL